MATYAEIAGIREDADFNAFMNKIRVAAVVKAQAILDEATPTTAEVAWAKSSLDDPVGAGDSVVWYAIAANKAASLSAILGASDTAIQTAVDAAVDAITSGGV